MVCHLLIRQVFSSILAASIHSAVLRAVLAIPVYLDLATTVWRTILIKWKKFLSRETEMVEVSYGKVT